MKKLVVYYSLGGNTKAVAMQIARSLRADVLEISTAKEYPDDYDVLVSLGQKEVESGYMPQLKPFSLDLSKYEAILIGTPVWWYTYAPAVKKFMSGFHWKGKRVYPFATNGGLLGHTFSDFKKALRGAKVAPILNVKFDNNVQVTPESVVKSWISDVRKTEAEFNAAGESNP